ncbi:MAG: NTP transferase domain-containing protein [Alphaproteobacteria bacterium]|nr:NTP transferase domain-containing protein [Alphaproteobacteria bacterium]
MADALREVGGLILAGGRSSRFGAEKALAIFRGRMMLDHAYDALSACAAVAVSAGRQSGAAAAAAARGLDVLGDDPALPKGPLAGIASGLAWAQALGLAWLATAPCDAPLIGAETFARLEAARGDACAVYAVTADGAEPLVALWRAALLRPLTTALRAGAHPSIHGFLDAQGARRAVFENAAPFANINTSSDLARLE